MKPLLQFTRRLGLLLMVASLSAAAANPGRTQFFVTEYGATGDGKTLDTGAIQAAIDACARQGGGTVSLPAGTYLSGTLELKSCIVLRIEPGAVLRGSGELKDYRDNGFKHNEMGETTSLLYAIDQNDIRITGGGVIDLNDQPFMHWDQPRPALPPAEAAQLGERQWKECVVQPAKRPSQPVFFQNCRRLRLDDITVRNAPCWTISINSSRDIRIDHLLIDNNPVVPNNDGIHFCSSQDIVVSDCIIRAGDDCLAFTGITNWDGICERIVVTNCSLSAKSAGVRLGHLASKIRNAVFSNLVISDSNRGFAIQAGDGGWVENIQVSNVIIDTRIICGEWWGKGEPLLIATSGSGRISGVSFSHIRAHSDNSIVVVGSQYSVSNIALQDWDLTLRYGLNRPLYGRFIDVQPAPTRPALDAEKRIPWLYAMEVRELLAQDIRFRSEDTPPRDVTASVSDVIWTPGTSPELIPQAKK
jgi:polygalacturonase